MNHSEAGYKAALASTTIELLSLFPPPLSRVGEVDAFAMRDVTCLTIPGGDKTERLSVNRDIAM